MREAVPFNPGLAVLALQLRALWESMFPTCARRRWKMGMLGAVQAAALLGGGKYFGHSDSAW